MTYHVKSSPVVGLGCHWQLAARVLVVLLTATTAFAAPTTLPIADVKRTTPVDFESDILPAFRASCLPCHNRTTSKGGLILETPQTIAKGGDSGPAVLPGKSAESPLLILASHRDKPVMPPAGNKAAAPNLTPDQLGLLRLWIDRGAKGEVRLPSNIEWKPIPSAFMPSYAVAVTPDGQFAAVGRGSQLVLYHLPYQSIIDTIPAHRDAIHSLAISPDGRTIASGSFAEVKLWRRAPAAPKFSFASAAPVRHVAANPDGKWLAIAAEDRPIRLVDAATGDTVRSIPAPPTPVRAMRFSPDSARLFVASEKSLLLVSPSDGSVTEAPAAQPPAADAYLAIRQFVHGLPAHVAVRSDGKVMASAADGSVKLRDVEKGTVIAELKGNRDLVRIVSQKQESAQLAAADIAYHKSVLTKVEATLKAQEERLKKATDGKAAAATSLEEKHAAAKKAADAGSAAEQALAAAVEQHKRAAIAAAAVELNKLAIAALSARRAPLDAEHKSAAAALAAINAVSPPVKAATDALAAATAAQAAPDNALKAATLAHANASNELDLATAAVARASGEITTTKSVITAAEAVQRQRDADLAAAKNAAVLGERTPRALAFSADNKLLAAAADDGLVHLFHADAGLPLDVIPAHRAAVSSVGFSGDGHLLTASADGVASVWPLTPRFTHHLTIGTGDLRSPLADRVNALAFSPDSAVLATGSGEPSRGGEVKLWSIADGKPLRSFDNTHSDAVLALDFSRDGKRLASAAADRFAKILDLDAGRLLNVFEGHTHHVLAVSFRADQRTLATGGADGHVKIWDLVSGERRGNVPPAPTEIAAVRHLGISDQFVAVAANGQLRVINDAGAVVRTFANAGDDHLHAAAVAADGRTLLLAGQSGTLYLWDAAAGKLLATLPPPPL